jgi:anti-repressor protein
MNELINISNHNGNLVVSSREVAINFEKQHKHIMESIRDLETSVEKSAHLFITSTYKDSYGRDQNEYLLTRDGFSLLVMGFTGKKALEWKLKYIEAFNKMEKTLQETKRLSPMEQLKLQYEVLDEHEERLSYLENSMTVDFGQQRTLQNKAKSKVISALGGIQSHAYKNNSLRTKVFSAIWRDYKDYFNVASYRDTARVNFEKALDYLGNWQVQGKLLREIEECNNQLGFKEII